MDNFRTFLLILVINLLNGQIKSKTNVGNYYCTEIGVSEY